MELDYITFIGAPNANDAADNSKNIMCSGDWGAEGHCSTLLQGNSWEINKNNVFTR